MKWLNLITVFVFGSFVWVNHNDFDFLKWTLVYAPMAVLALYGIFRKVNSNILLIYSTALLFYLIIHLGDFAVWSRAGMPSIIDLDTKNVELMREYFGVMITLLVALGYWLYWRKK